MRTALAIAGVFAVFAGAGPAGAAAPQSPAPTLAPAAASASKAAPDKPGSTVSGVTVQALPHKPCAPKDKDCIAIVMAQVKELYPEQLKEFCFRENMDVLKANMQANIAGWCDSPTRGAEALCHRHVSQTVQQVCAPDKLAAKAEPKK